MHANAAQELLATRVLQSANSQVAQLERTLAKGWSLSIDSKSGSYALRVTIVGRQR